MFRPITQAISSNFIFTVSSLLGIFPFRIEDELKIDQLLFFYSVVITCLMTVCWLTIVSWKTIYSHLFFDSFITVCFYTLHSPIFLSQIFCLFIHRNEFVDSVQFLDILMNKFRKNMSVIKDSGTILKIISLEIFPFLLCSISFQFGSLSVEDILIQSFYMVFLLGIVLSCGQFIFFSDAVSEIFESSSKFLLSIKHPVTFKKVLTVEKRIDALSQLVTLSGKINDIYSKQLLIAVGIGFVGIINHLYYIYQNTSSNIEWKHLRIPGDCLMLLYRFYILWRLSHSAAVANYKSKKFNILLYQLMMEDTTDELLRNDKLKLHISMKREVVFTACGFFRLDYTLLYSIITSATTYLVILIQFGELVD
ncbi:Gustatory receptor 51 [Halyomorpha halys]|nr:Gustatory receptor 51 [Halyomorpha halys]